MRLMQERNALWQQRFGLSEGCAFHWDINTATIRFRRHADEVTSSICVVGTTSNQKGTFLWGWANERIPAIARKGLELVREFGARHRLPLLTTPEFPGGRSEAIEVAAITGRALDAEGIFIDPRADVTLFFALAGFQTGPLNSGREF